MDEFLHAFACLFLLVSPYLSPKSDGTLTPTPSISYHTIPLYLVCFYLYNLPVSDGRSVNLSWPTLTTENIYLSLLLSLID